MASTIYVDKLDPQSGTALEIGTSGDTITVPSGATLTIAGTINASTGTATGFAMTGWSTGGTSNSFIPSATDQGVYLGVSSATAANLLDDYEFGTWTPDADPTSSSFTTKGTMTGYYTKVGNIVHAQAQVNITTAGSASGNIEVYNFPFSSATTGLVHTLNWCRETQIAGANYPAIMSRNVTTVIILAPAFGNGASYDINATYRVA